MLKLLTEKCQRVDQFAKRLLRFELHSDYSFAFSVQRLWLYKLLNNWCFSQLCNVGLWLWVVDDKIYEIDGWIFSVSSLKNNQDIIGYFLCLWLLILNILIYSHLFFYSFIFLLICFDILFTFRTCFCYSISGTGSCFSFIFLICWCSNLFFFSKCTWTEWLLCYKTSWWTFILS